jgi:hypothetical protein
MESKRPITLLARLQNGYREYPQPFWVWMAGTFIDRLGTNLIIPFLAIYVAQRFDAEITQIGLVHTIFAAGSGVGNILAGATRYPSALRCHGALQLDHCPCAKPPRCRCNHGQSRPRWAWYGCSMICAVSIVGFHVLHLRARDRLTAKPEMDLPADQSQKMKGIMPQTSIVIFVCEHGAAKSVIAAAYFNRLASQGNLALTAVARGTHPES